MAKRLDVILVIDVESTCWDGSPPKDEVSEIIEVGICPLKVGTLERGEKVSLLIKPEMSTVSPFCTELTTIQPEDVASAGSFADACRRLRSEFQSRDRVWASWGDYDRVQFERTCERLGVAYPFGRRHINAKTLYALAKGLNNEPGMARALEREGLPLVGTHHRGHDDAWNIAGLLASVLRPGRS